MSKKILHGYLNLKILYCLKNANNHLTRQGYLQAGNVKQVGEYLLFRYSLKEFVNIGIISFVKC